MHNTAKKTLLFGIKRGRIRLFSLLTTYSLLLTVSYAEPPSRIISLSPAVTEILFAAGLGDRVVGVTNFCDYPEEAKTKPKIGGMSNPSLEAVISLKPDIVILTTDGNPQQFERRLRSMNIKTFVFETLTLPELPDGIRKMGLALHAEKDFEPLALKIEQTITKFKMGKTTGGKKVLFIIWPEPLIVAGARTAIDDAINLLGGINIAGMSKSRYPKYSLEEIFRQSPDIIFIGKGHKNMRKLASGLLKRLSHIEAVKKNHVFFVSDSLYRHGPRVSKGMEELAHYLNK
jgi:iron complex transport system substrate-binding protein